MFTLVYWHLTFLVGLQPGQYFILLLVCWLKLIKFSCMFPGRTRTWQELPAMQASIHILGLVSWNHVELVPNILFFWLNSLLQGTCCYYWEFCYLWADKFHLNISIMDCCMFLRTEQKGWLGVSGLCAYVLLAGQVSVLQVLFFWFQSKMLVLLWWWMFFLKYFTAVGCASLPWQGLKAGTKKQKYEKISEKKMSTPIEVK